MASRRQSVLHNLVPVAFDQRGVAVRAVAGVALAVAHIAGVDKLQALLHGDVARFERWFAQGLIDQVDFTHLLFLVWAMTQAYADHEAQFALYLGKPRLEAPDYAAATQLMAKMVIATLRP